MAEKTSSYEAVLEEVPLHLEQAYSHALEFKPVPKQFDHVFVFGMGGSGIAGDLLHILQPKYVSVVKNFDTPPHVTKESLCFVCSYSGNTAETIEAFRKIQRIGATIISLGSGGKLKQLCEMYDLPFIKIPSKFQPRQVVGHFTITLLHILSKYGVGKLAMQDIRTLSKSLTNPKYKEQGQSLAEKLGNRIPIIYASEKLYPVAYRWKTQFNENAKVHAFSNVIPELNHNEICGYQQKQDNFFTIILKDNRDDLRIQKRMDALMQVIKESQNHCIEILIKGETDLQKIFSALYLGDWTSYYYAVQNDVDPTPVELIESFKKKVR